MDGEGILLISPSFVTEIPSFLEDVGANWLWVRIGLDFFLSGIWNRHLSILTNGRPV
jgi:hypothetical protein